MDEHELVIYESYIRGKVHESKRRWWRRRKRDEPTPRWFAVSSIPPLQVDHDGPVFVRVHVPYLNGAYRVIVDDKVRHIERSVGASSEYDFVISTAGPHTIAVEFAGGSEWVGMPTMPVVTTVRDEPFPWRVV